MFKLTLPDPRTRDGIKTITRFVVARATSLTIVAVISQNVETDGPLSDAGVYIGAHVLGEMVAEKTHGYVNEQIDALADTVAAFKEAKAELQAPQS